MSNLLYIEFSNNYFKVDGMKQFNQALVSSQCI